MEEENDEKADGGGENEDEETEPSWYELPPGAFFFAAARAFIQLDNLYGLILVPLVVYSFLVQILVYLVPVCLEIPGAFGRNRCSYCRLDL